MRVDIIDIRWCGQGITEESCPFSDVGKCRLAHIPCCYGLTEVTVPISCPMIDDNMPGLSISVNTVETETDQPDRKPHHASKVIDELKVISNKLKRMSPQPPKKEESDD